jgi:sulfate adenylyltransferase subunit 1 (EFTu-like GTPase family)
MKVNVIGSGKEGRVIQGKVKIGQEVVIRHKGKVERGVVVRTKKRTPTEVSYGKAAIMIKG